MITRLLLTVAVTLPLSLFAVSAHAALPPGNIVQNGDAEAGPGATNETDHQPVPGWEVLPNFTAVVYGTSGFPDAATSDTLRGGTNFFAGGPDYSGLEISFAHQTIDISDAAPEIDRGNVQATLSADLGGKGSERDSATVTSFFTDGTNQTFHGFLHLEPVDAEARGSRTTLIRRTACTTLTPGAREAFIQVAMERRDPPYNDGYADNVSIRLSTDPCPPPADAPLPPPAEPKPGVSANASVVSGRVLVKRPGGSFQELEAERSIPIGAEVDVSKGTVSLETAANNRGKTQRARFYDGSFILGQTRGRAPITDLKLTGGRIDKCPSRSQATTSARRTRRLWGRGRGRFRTRGRYATATVRGTVWSVQDTCTYTKVRVARGTVIVRDLSKRRNIKVKGGRSYTARARRR